MYIRRIIALSVLACLLLAILLSMIFGYNEARRIHRYDAYIRDASEQYHIDGHLIRAVIWRESNYNPRAFGKAQERGLMQVTPIAGMEWAKEARIKNFQPDDLFKPSINIQAGTWYLARARNRWQQTDVPEIFALAEYNAGRTNALRWAKDLPELTGASFWDRIDFPTTKAYILTIMEQYGQYRMGIVPGPLDALKMQLRQWWRKNR